MAIETGLVVPVEERDFSNFVLGDNVTALAGGLILEMADRAGVNVGDGTDPEMQGVLVGKYGKDKVLRNNEEVDISLEEAVELVERSGVQNGLDRSLWTPDMPTPVETDAFGTGGVPNWEDRTAKILFERSGAKNLWLPVGNRPMTSAPEAKNPNWQQYNQDNGHAPTESDYAKKFMVSRLTEERSDETVHFMPQETGNGDEIAVAFAQEHPELFAEGTRLAVARVANAGVQLAVQVRKAGRMVNPNYDTDPNNPQMFILTDSFPIAETREQIADSAHYQSPYTALRQVALTAKLLTEAAQA